MSTSPDSPSPAKQWPRLRWWQPIGLMMAISFASGGVPAQLPFSLFSMDKVIHLLVFGLLSTSIYRLANPRWPAGGRAILAICVTAVFGLVDELHQSQTPGRFMDFDDWIADVTGAVLAVYVYRSWRGYRRFLEFAPFPRKPKIAP